MELLASACGYVLELTNPGVCHSHEFRTGTDVS